MPLAIIILLLVLLSIAVRNFLPFKLPIWLLMLIGAIAALATQQISLLEAYHSIDFEIIFYLFGVFVIAEGLESSGLLEHVTEQLFNYSNSTQYALFIIIFILGLSSALLMNDAIAIIGTPIILQLCRKQKQLAGILLMALAYAITIGSVMSPVGNPQNLLIAVESQMSSPFVTFILGLGLPTLICLGLLYFSFVTLFRNKLKSPIEKIAVARVSNKRLGMASAISLLIFLSLIILKILLELLHVNFKLDFASVALIAAIPIILFGNARKQTIKNLDWGTLIFFVAMFILMQAVWNSGFFQNLINKHHIAINSVPSILGISSILSQFISNVPLVALYLPLLQHAGASVFHYLALAAGSTLAGNIFVFGAASNMIIIQNAEKRGFFDFKVGLFSLMGIPLTLASILIYAGFIEWIK